MKQVFIFTAAIYLLVTAGNGMAQTGVAIASVDQGSYYYHSIDSFVSNVPLNEISTRAFRYLLQNYPGVDKEKWFRTEDGFTVIFENDSVLSKIFFNNKGYFISSFKYYTQESADAGLRKWVQALFPGYTIETITEKDDGRFVEYGIILSNSRLEKCVDIFNNEIKNVEEFSRVAVAR